MSGTRVTHRTIATNALANLQHSLAASQRLSDRLSSGRQIQRPSDDPSGTVTALQIRADSRAQQQYSRNADDGLGWLSVTDGALNSGITALRRARELTLRGANSGSNGLEARQALATEIEAIKNNMLEIANTTYMGRPVFGGTTGGSVAFDATGTYVGDQGSVERRLSDTATVAANTDGVAIFGNGPTSLFALLDKVATDLRQDPPVPAAVDDNLGRLSEALERFSTGLAGVGARYARMESLRQTADDKVMDLRSALSEVENIDLPKTILEMQMQEVAHQAALGATAKVIQPTLMDFLR